MAERAMLYPLFEQVPVGLPDGGPGRDAENLHDLVAVQVGTQPVELLLRRKDGDSPFQVVVGTLKPLRLLPVPGRAVGPGQHVQPGEQGAGIAHITADGGIGPLAVGVSVEPQVEPHERGHVRDHGGREAKRGQPFARHGRPDHLVMVERHPAARQQAACLGLADVMKQRGQPHHQVAAQAVGVLEGDGPPEDGEGVLVDVLVPEVLVCLQPQGGDLRQDLLRHAGVDKQRYAAHGTIRSRRPHQLRQLDVDPFHRHHGEAVGECAHGGADLGCHPEPELGGEPGRAQYPQRVVGERILGRARRAEQPAPEVAEAAEGVHRLQGRKPRRDGVDREITP